LAGVDLYLHLDHGKSFKIIEKAIEYDFDSIMYDGSSLPKNENIAKTRQVKEMIGSREIVLEAELGHVGRQVDDDGLLSNPEDADDFAQKTEVDLLAVSIGSVHGIVKNQDLDYDRLAQIREQVDIPLVIHGCSGLDNVQIKKLVEGGANKFNIDSEIRKAFMDGLRENVKESDPRRALGASIMEMKEVVKDKIEVISNN
jgi:ketose-bisphosphate aldolase